MCLVNVKVMEVCCPQVARREHQQQQQTNGANGASGNGGAIYDSAETEVLKKGARELQNKVTKVLANYINSQMPELGTLLIHYCLCF